MTALLHAAVERGITFFDTAEVYGPFTNEELVGEALAPVPRASGDRHQIRVRPQSEARSSRHEGRPGLNSRPEHIKQAVEGSLKRLKIESIDLLYQHRVDPERADRRRRGSCEGTDSGRQGQALRPFRGGRADHPPRARRPARRRPAERILAVDAEPEREVIPTLEELGIGLVPYSPLGKGLPHGED